MSNQEKALVEAAKIDPNAFGQLYDKYVDQIYRYVYRRVNDKETAEDIVSQTFCSALENLESYEYRGFPFSSWLYKIAHNYVIKWYRTHNRVNVVPVEEAFGLSDKSMDQEADFQNLELRGEIDRVLELMDEPDREIVRLKYFEELSNKEIADVMEISANHVGVKLYRALRKMQKLMPY